MPFSCVNFFFTYAFSSSLHPKLRYILELSILSFPNICQTNLDELTLQWKAALKHPFTPLFPVIRPLLPSCCFMLVLCNLMSKPVVLYWAFNHADSPFDASFFTSSDADSAVLRFWFLCLSICINSNVGWSTCTNRLRQGTDCTVTP